MASLVQKGLLQSSSPIKQIVRFRGKINIQRPRAPNYEKARIIMATRPQLQPKQYNASCIEYEANKVKINVENPYEKIIAREVRNWFDHSKVVAFFHRNPIGSEDEFNARVAFHRQGMSLKAYSKNILKLALDGTKFETVLPLFVSHNCIVFSPEKKVSQILKIVKKNPQLILLGGIAEDRYLSKNEFVALATVPGIQTCRSQFAATLDSVGGQLVNNLQTHQTQLVTLLDMYANPQPDSKQNTDTDNDKQ